MFKKILFFISLTFFTFITAALYAIDYNKNSMKIDFFGGIGSVSGEIMDTEHDISRLTVTYADGNTEEGKPVHIDYHCGLFSDLIISESSGNIVQYCIRGMYTYNLIEQQIRTGHINYDETLLDEIIIKYHSFTVGPVVTLIPDADNNTGNKLNMASYINFFILTGPILCGSLTPAPIVRGSDPALRSLPQTDFYGIQLNSGLGFGVFIGPLDFGFNLYYCGNWIKTDQKVYPSVNKETFFNGARIDIFLGFHL